MTGIIVWRASAPIEFGDASAACRAFAEAMREHEAGLTFGLVHWIGHGVIHPGTAHLVVPEVLEIRTERVDPTLPVPPVDLCPQLIAEIDLVRAYVVANSGWASLTGVMERGETGDARVAFCRAWATKQGDSVGAYIATLLLSVHERQRRKLRSWWYGIGSYRQI